mgnify:CR=1 FL=1|jgi:hypothetical protein
MAYGSKSGGMKKMGAAPKFKPCPGCPTPSACKRAGMCLKKKYGK